MEFSRNDFPYDQIDSRKGQIRLLEILPAVDKDQQVQCNISHASLEDDPNYLTLSYMWGDPKITVPILLRGHNSARLFYITTNLEAALKVIRSFGFSERKLWIDAICINQSDLQERSDQISLMARIYVSGKFSILWLGVADRPCRLAVKILRRRLKYEEFKGIVVGYDDDRLVQFIEDLLYIFNMPVWRRIWILQEVCSAKNLYAFYGDTLLQGSGIAASLRITAESTARLDAPNYLPLIATLRTSPGLRIWTQRLLSSQAGQGIHLMAVMKYSCGILKSTDPRDQVYAVLGIVKHAPVVVPDYDRAVWEIFCQFTFDYMIETRSLALLEFSSNQESRTWVDGIALPSWSPNFLQRPAGGFVSRSTYSGANNPIYHSGLVNTGRQGSSIWRLRRQNQRKLLLSGVAIDSVREITTVSTIGFGELSSTEAYQEMFARALPHAEQISKPYPDESTFDAYWRTLICNLDNRDTRPRQLALEDRNTFRLAFQQIMGTSDQENTSTVGDIDSRQPVGDLSEIVKIFQECFWIYKGRDFNFGYASQGYMAMFPTETRVGDEICVFIGAEIPYVIRRVSESADTHEIVGPAYVHGIMDGEVMGWIGEGKIEETTFKIVLEDFSVSRRIEIEEDYLNLQIDEKLSEARHFRK